MTFGWNEQKKEIVKFVKKCISRPFPTWNCYVMLKELIAEDAALVFDMNAEIVERAGPGMPATDSTVTCSRHTLAVVFRDLAGVLRREPAQKLFWISALSTPELLDCVREIGWLRNPERLISEQRGIVCYSLLESVLLVMDVPEDWDRRAWETYMERNPSEEPEDNRDV